MHCVHQQGDASDSKDSAPKEGPYWSLMFEVSESKLKPVNQKQIGLAGGKWPEIVKETIIGALNTKMIDAEAEIVSVYHRWALPLGVWLSKETAVGCPHCH